jgi:hypothetical protein
MEVQLHSLLISVLDGGVCVQLHVTADLPLKKLLYTLSSTLGGPQSGYEGLEKRKSSLVVVNESERALVSFSSARLSKCRGYN